MNNTFSTLIASLILYTDTLAQATSFQVSSHTTLAHDAKCIVDFTASYNNGAETTYQYNNYYGLRPDSLEADNLLQHQGQTNALFNMKNQYISRGRNGLSISTGASFTATDPQQIWDFDLVSYDINAIGDGIPDFFSVALDSITSGDSWALIDANGNDLAKLNLQTSDWTTLGTQDLTRIDTTTSPSWTLTDINDIEFSGLAAELSDFIVVGTGQNLTSTDSSLLSQVTGLRVKVSDGGAPETDYAFIATNQVSMDFLQTAPEPSTSLLSILALSLLAGKRTRD